MDLIKRIFQDKTKVTIIIALIVSICLMAIDSMLDHMKHINH